MSSFNEPVQVMACSHLAVFTATGADTQAFLQSQLTQDMQTITDERAGLAGFCTAQGRLWASMFLLGDSDGGVIGVARADLMESFLKRLRMFVLRSKVTFNADTPAQVSGLVINRADESTFCQVTGARAGQPDWSVSATDYGRFVVMPNADEGLVRYLLITTDVELERLMALLGPNVKQRPDATYWQALDATSGIGWIEAATQDLFIAQTLNLDLLDGVSFTKGCYPGQEVVARAHYRGTVKRRMHLARVEGTTAMLSAGTDIFEASQPDNPVGRLISVAPQGDHTLVLYEAPFKIIDNATDPSDDANGLRAGSADGPVLVPQPLPYALVQN